MANRAKRGGKQAGTRGAKTKAPAKKTKLKKTSKKPYRRDDHRHAPRGKAGSSQAKLKRETTGVDEDLDYGAATRGLRWSRAPAVYAGGMPDRRQNVGRRASDQAPPESFTRQGQSDQTRR